MTAIMRKMEMTNPKLIQIGASTHHQDQAMWPVSLRVMKTMVRRPTNPIPPLDDEDLDMMVFDVWVEIGF